MATNSLLGVVRHLRRHALRQDRAALADGALLEAFVTRRDHAAFEELLRRFPDFENASAAQLYIGQSYAEEKKLAEADSVYQLVVKNYPKSSDAPTALYKFGLSRLSQGKTADGKAALQQVVREYPRSPEAELAEGRLKNIK